MLQSEGLVQFEPHRGARVRSLTINDIGDLYKRRPPIPTAIPATGAKTPHPPSFAARAAGQGAMAVVASESASCFSMRLSFSSPSAMRVRRCSSMAWTGPKANFFRTKITRKKLTTCAMKNGQFSPKVFEMFSKTPGCSAATASKVIMS